VITHSKIRKRAKQVGHTESLQQLRAEVGDMKEKLADPVKKPEKRENVQTTISGESPLTLSMKGYPQSESRKERLAALQVEFK
jgi:hypothetical protein